MKTFLKNKIIRYYKQKRIAQYPKRFIRTNDSAKSNSFDTK